jgi:PAS domain S-box-containing protein
MDAQAGPTIKILILEDVATDAELIERVLRHAGLHFVALRAATKDAFTRALDTFRPDILLSDYNLPDLDGPEALRIALAKYPDLPVIEVTGAVGDEAAVDLVRAGAKDYVLKDRMARLPFAIQHALSEAEETRRRRQAEQKIREDEARYRGLVEQDIAGIFILATDGTVAYVNRCLTNMFGGTPAEVIGRPFIDFVADPYKDAVQETFKARLSGQPAPDQMTVAIKGRDGRLIDVLVHAALSTHQGRPTSMGVMLDITEQKRAERALTRLNRTLRTLSSSNAALVRAATEADLLVGMCRIIVEVGSYPLAWIGMAQHDPAKSVTPVAWAGGGAAYLETVKITWSDSELGRGPTGTAIRTGATQVNRDFAANPAMAPWREAAANHGYTSNIALALKDRGEVLGALTIYSAEADAFDADEVKLLTELAEDLSYGMVALRNRAGREAAVERLKDSLGATVTALASMVELRDAYTAGHQRRVASLAGAIARQMGLSEDRIQGILLAGVIHDVGKIQVPAEILSKPTRLRPLEFELIKAHPRAGYDIVRSIDFPWPIADMILQHHERLDGSGYPDGLKGDAIRLESRILAVADVVEAMMSHRPYRAELGLDAALAEVEAGKGTRYDAAAVDACRVLFREKGFAF